MYEKKEPKIDEQDSDTEETEKNPEKNSDCENKTCSNTEVEGEE